MANEFSKWIQTCKASESVRDACLSLYESVTEPALYLRRAYKTVKDCEHTPKFNKEWHKRNTDGTWGPVQTVLDNQFMLKDIAGAIDPDDPDTGMTPEELKQLEECDYYDLDENDTYRILEAVPQYAVEHIRNSDEYLNSDYSAMTFNHTVVNQWLVHNTDHAWDIWSDGFMYGNDVGQLAYSNAGSTQGKEFGEYLFAFPIDDAPSPSYRDGLKYGKASVVFVGTGNEFFHYGDDENQVIFDRRQPSGCFVVDKEDEVWNVYGKDMYRPLISSEYDRCLEWIKKNGADYAGQMKMWKTDGVISRHVNHRPVPSPSRRLRNWK